MFRDAENIVVQGGQFNVINQPANAVVRSDNTSSDVIAILRRHSATAGLLDARERFDAPKCDEDTRTTMIREMKRWVQSGDELRPSMFWLHGPAGVGKSALGQSVALALHEERDLAASFFFSRTAAGRNNGAQLVATLACQLAVHIPKIRPFISKSIEENPFIFESSNKLQMEKLIIEPVNKLQQSLQTWWTRLSRIMRSIPRPGRRRPATSRYNRTKGTNIPRLILVDGLDECENSAVQCDLILCLGHAVRSMRLPFRIIIASRPESHIISTFKMNKLFNPPHGVVVRDLDLGEDPEADQSIRTFLSKEFAEIRRTHPLRNYLPDPWPTPEDIDHLVRKSSKTFIYPTTVIRYIKLPNNRPEECLRRILGMAEIPSFEKPYEILDNLYHHIFQSIPEVNKKAVFEVFHILIGGSDVDPPPKMGWCTTPTIIERLLSYEPGHVEHILGDLLCVVGMSGHRFPIRILHASLADFFMDAARSRHLYINKGEANKMIAGAYYRIYFESEGCIVHGFNRVLVHSKQATMTGATLPNSLRSIDLVQCHTWAYHRYYKRESSLSDFVESSISFAAFMAMISGQNRLSNEMFEYLCTIEDYLHTLPAVKLVFSMIDGFLPYIVPLLRPFLQSHWLLVLLERGSSNILEEIIRAHMLMLIPIFLPIESEPLVMEQSTGSRHAQLAIISMKAVFSTDPWSDTNNTMVRTMSLHLVTSSLEKADYYAPLVVFLEAIDDYATQSASRIGKEDMQQMEGMVLDYLRVGIQVIHHVGSKY
ncbi:hypothetical protein D9619_009936 [Psilocybe cf. subviscida]|uniref:Nephrocystin 3-like N-terminal domain-containing protein n=1 Tax=Psilocybe cf. subviscida TaxID=2480587 RepID=A0A8H5BN34_9AGAR|nr:hypothetical protein D9619_009936 [Psilocybe cf. subviscida]